MGNICEIFSSNKAISKTYSTPVTVATPVYEYDIADSEKTSSTRLYPNANVTPIATAIPIETQQQQPQVVVLNSQYPYYNNPTINAMDGLITGMLIGEMLD